MVIETQYVGEQYGGPTYIISYDNIGELTFSTTEYEIVLEALFIDPQFRLKGIARELVNTLENVARESGYNNIISPVFIQKDIVLSLEALGFSGCLIEDRLGIEQIKIDVSIENNIKYEDGLIMMCKEVTRVT